MENEDFIVKVHSLLSPEAFADSFNLTAIAQVNKGNREKFIHCLTLGHSPTASLTLSALPLLDIPNVKGGEQTESQSEWIEAFFRRVTHAGMTAAQALKQLAGMVRIERESAEAQLSRMPTETLLELVEGLAKRIAATDLAINQIRQVSIPPQPTDSDMFLKELVKRHRNLLRTFESIPTTTTSHNEGIVHPATQMEATGGTIKAFLEHCVELRSKGELRGGFSPNLPNVAVFIPVGKSSLWKFFIDLQNNRVTTSGIGMAEIMDLIGFGQYTEAIPKQHHPYKSQIHQFTKREAKLIRRSHAWEEWSDENCLRVEMSQNHRCIPKRRMEAARRKFSFVEAARLPKMTDIELAELAEKVDAVKKPLKCLKCGDELLGLEFDRCQVEVGEEREICGGKLAQPEPLSGEDWPFQTR